MTSFSERHVPELETNFRTAGGSSSDPTISAVMARLLTRDVRTIAATAQSAPVLSVQALNVILDQKLPFDADLVTEILNHKWQSSGAALPMRVATVLIAKGAAKELMDLLERLPPDKRGEILAGGDVAIAFRGYARDVVRFEKIALAYPGNPAELLFSMERLLRPLTVQGRVTSSMAAGVLIETLQFQAALNKRYDITNYQFLSYVDFYELKDAKDSRKPRPT